MSTRRTRAHPSPGGLKSLPIDPPKRTRRQPARPKQTAAVAAEPAVSSEDSITIPRPPSPSPAPPTSRSQSPHILESDSQSAAIESRSSSPPTDDKSRWTRSQTTSTSPHSKHPPAPLPKRKTKPVTKTTTRNTRKRGRSQRAAAPKIIGSFPEEVEAGDDQSVEENIVVQDSQDYKADESSDAKLTIEKSPVRKYAKGRKSRTPQASDAPSSIRSPERRSTPRKSTEFTSFAQQAGDTSDSDLADEERAPKRSRVNATKYSPRNSGSPGAKSSNRQLSSAKSPVMTESKQIANSLENPPSLLPRSSDMPISAIQDPYPQRELPQLMSRRGSPSKSLSYTTRRVVSTPKTSEDDESRFDTRVIGPLPRDGEQRLQLWMDTYKIKPELLTSYRRGTRAKASSDSEEDDEAADSGDEYEKLTRSLPPKRGGRGITLGRKIPFDPSKNISGKSQIAKDNEKTRLSTTNSICETLTITSNVSQQKQVLTDPALIGFINQAINWFGADESRKVPSAEKFAAFLDGSEARAPVPTDHQIRIAAGVAAMQAEQASEAAEYTETEEQQSEAPSHIDKEEQQEDIDISEPTQVETHDDSEAEVEVIEEAGDVDITHEVEDEDSQVDTEHVEVEPTNTPPPQQSRGWMSPWTGVSAVANIFTTPLKLFGGRSHSASKATNRRIVGAATQPRKLSQRQFQGTPSRRRRVVPQTERPRRYGDEEKPPIHLRGIASPARIAEIQRKEDEMMETQRKREEEMAAARRKTRYAATVEEDSEDDGATISSIENPETKSGQKRKRPYRPPRTPPRSAPGTFRVPSPSSSSEDDYSDEEPPTPTPGQAPKTTLFGKPIEKPIEKRLLGPSQTQLKDRLTADESISGFGTEERARPYTGKAAQPKSIQANTNDGKFQLAPRSDVDETGTTIAAAHNVSSPSAVRNIFEAERLTKGNIEKLNEANTPAKDTALPTKPIVFKAPSESGSDTDEEVNEQPSTSALQTKKWTQTPPPKPRPSNASLPKKPSTSETSPVKPSEPQITQQHTGDLARVRGAAEKFKPKQPSRLREVIQMSPNQIQEHEGKYLALAREIESTVVKFDPAVMAALNAIPDKDLHDITIPFDYSQHILDPLVQREVQMLAI